MEPLSSLPCHQTSCPSGFTGLQVARAALQEEGLKSIFKVIQNLLQILVKGQGAVVSNQNRTGLALELVFFHLQASLEGLVALIWAFFLFILNCTL